MLSCSPPVHLERVSASGKKGSLLSFSAFRSFALFYKIIMSGRSSTLAVVGLCFFLALLSCPMSLADNPLDEEETLFRNFINQFNRTYSPGSEEYKKRLTAFKASLRRHERLNAVRPHPASAKYGVNQFSDLFPNEFRNLFGLSTNNSLWSQLWTTPTQPNSKIYNSDGQVVGEKVGQSCGAPLQCSTRGAQLEVPDYFDWRQHNAVPPVRNQAECGSCWAFTTVESIESAWAIKTGNLLKLSPQEFISCVSTAFGCNGCKGGSPFGGFTWLLKTGSPVIYDSEMPYKGDDYECPEELSTQSPVKITNFSCCVDVTPQAELDQLKAVVYQHGPVAVEISAAGLQDYLEGIIQHHCPPISDAMHSVMLVGYDTRGEIPYWIVENSWGTSWGLNGYFLAEIGKNICGIGQRVAYPQV